MSQYHVCLFFMDTSIIQPNMQTTTTDMVGETFEAVSRDEALGKAIVKYKKRSSKFLYSYVIWEPPPTTDEQITQK